MGIAGYIFYIASLRERRRNKNRKLRKSLLSYFKRFDYVVPLVDFAEKNNVKVSDAQKFIDMLIEHYRSKLDINEQGIIVYKSEYFKKEPGKKRKRKRQ
jgi:GTPase involved in cell partitioning and DNA repair